MFPIFHEYDGLQVLVISHYCNILSQDKRDKLDPNNLVLHLEQVDLISVCCDVRVNPVGIAWLLGQSYNQALINIIGETDEFESRHHDFV